MKKSWNYNKSRVLSFYRCTYLNRPNGFLKSIVRDGNNLPYPISNFRDLRNNNIGKVRSNAGNSI